jgi:SpoVK/Ycf46/Vps4 family AAA+-type ATPase
VARYGTSYKSTAEAALTTRRRQRVSLGTSKKKETEESPPKGCQNDSDMIAGRKKYSDIAKESDWADQELIESIEREIVDRGEPTGFDDIAGLDHTKQLLQEAVMLPQIAPHLFKVHTN